jgi:hypothetical protein
MPLPRTCPERVLHGHAAGRLNDADEISGSGEHEPAHRVQQPLKLTPRPSRRAWESGSEGCQGSTPAPGSGPRVGRRKSYGKPAWRLWDSGTDPASSSWSHMSTSWPWLLSRSSASPPTHGRTSSAGDQLRAGRLRRGRRRGRGPGAVVGSTPPRRPRHGAHPPTTWPPAQVSRTEVPAPVSGSTLLGGCLRLVQGAAGGAGVDAACAVTEGLLLGAAAGAQRGPGLTLLAELRVRSGLPRHRRLCGHVPVCLSAGPQIDECEALADAAWPAW